MGLLHCPLGAAYPDDEQCINCGLCSAKNKEEMLEATRKVKEYLRSKVDNAGPAKRTAICGRGGIGKSTLIV